MAPLHVLSSHLGEQKDAFDRVANSAQINDMFRSLFGKTHYALEVIDGMNEIYISGPARKDEKSNSDHVFFTRHVDGPYGLVPFVSVYRCIVGMDKNMMVILILSLFQSLFLFPYDLMIG